MAGQVECGNCSEVLSPRRSFPICSKCKKTYHYKCLKSIHQTHWRGWKPSEKQLWVCDYCEKSNSQDLVEKKVKKGKRSLSSPETQQGGPSKRLFAEEETMITKEEITALIVETVTGTVATAIAQAFIPVNEKIQKLIDKNTKEVHELRNENMYLKNRITELEERVEDGEQYSKKNNVIISGVPVQPNEDASEIVKKIASKCEIQIKEWDIVAAHRLQPRKNGDIPIIVKFHTKSRRKKTS